MCRHPNCVEIELLFKDRIERLMLCRDCLYCLTYGRDLSNIEVDVLYSKLKEEIRK